MYCSECGKVISDKSKFCRYCGAVIEPEEATPVNRSVGTVSEPKTPVSHTSVSVSNKPVTPPAKQEKKKEKWTFTDVIVLLIFVFVIVGISYSCGEGCNMASCLMSDTDKGSSESQLPTAVSNPVEYNALFKDTYIAHPQIISINKTAGYAKKDGYGNITCMDFCYDDDGVVLSMKITEYSNTKGFTDEQITQLENEVREADAKFVGASCITITYDKGVGYFSRKVNIEGLDNKDSRIVLNKIGFDFDDDKYLSMAVTEKEMLEDGFIKR